MSIIEYISDPPFNFYSADVFNHNDKKSNRFKLTVVNFKKILLIANKFKIHFLPKLSFGNTIKYNNKYKM